MMKQGLIFQRMGFGLLAASLALAVGSAANQSPVASAQGLATPSLTPAIVQFPTATPTLLGGPTATPSRTPSITPVLAQALGDINLRSGPGVNTEIVGQLKAGETVPVIGRSVQYPWYVVLWEAAPNGQAWVYKDVVQIIGDVTTLPIIDAPDVPTIEPTLFAQQQTATVVLQTPGAAETATAGALFLPTGVTTVTPSSGLFGGPLPTFTPPAPLNQPNIIAPPETPDAARGGIPSAVMIIALGSTGLLFLGLGLLRRVL